MFLSKRIKGKTWSSWQPFINSCTFNSPSLSTSILVKISSEQKTKLKCWDGFLWKHRKSALTSQYQTLFLVFVFLSFCHFCLFVFSWFRPFCHFVFVCFCIFVFWSFCWFCLFVFMSSWSNVWRVSSFKSHYLCQILKWHPVFEVRYRAARAAKKSAT